MPSTISSPVSVSREIQTCGSENNSIMLASKAAELPGVNLTPKGIYANLRRRLWGAPAQFPSRQMIEPMVRPKIKGSNPRTRAQR